MLTLLAVLGVLLSSVSFTAAGSNSKQVPDRYIVVLKPGVDADAVAADHGLSREHRYTRVFNGFSAKGAPGKLQKLQGDPRVAIAELDRVVELFAQTLPTGINRVDADLNATANINNVDNRVNVDIAILDTGIQTNHPDLYVVGGKNCATGASYSDGHGHVTHVAGTAAAKDDNNGVVGVALGARLWAVRVLDNRGSGYVSWILCGVDWVTANAGTIEVANMSLGGEFTSASLDAAIASSVGAGVTYAVAAGNSSKDAASFSPANHPDVLTVSAIADFNGTGGGGAAATCRADVDESFADFSNYGSLVEIAAPGVCIRSTYKGGKYATMSGTSMASPHVAGAAALVKANNPGYAPAQVRDALLASAKALSDATHGFTGDPDSHHEPLLYTAGL